MKDKLTAIFDAVTRAYETLKESAKAKEEPVTASQFSAQKSATAQEAEKHFKQGVGAFKKKDFNTAIESLRLATEIDPKQVKYWSHLSLFLTKIPNKLKEAEEALLEAITLEPYNAEHYVNLGMIYMKAGSKKKAGNQFEKALKFDSDNEKAKKGLEQIKR